MNTRTLIDWKVVIAELKDREVSMRTLSRECDIPLTCLSDAKSGKRLGGDYAVAVIKKWMNLTGCSIFDLPLFEQEIIDKNQHVTVVQPDE